MINIIKDVEPVYETEKYDVVLVGTSTHCMLSGSFQYKIGVKYPQVAEANNKTGYGDLRKLGKRVTVYDTKPIISLLYMCTYPTRKPTVDYEALEKCLKTANNEFKGKKVMTCILGATRFDGKGDREKCLEILERCTPDLDVDVYDYNMLSRIEEYLKIREFFYKKIIIYYQM
jgi:hypothetical protein